MSSPDPSKRDFRISKSLSYLLRHGAIKEKIPIDSQGWVTMTSILANNRLKSLQATQSDIERIVASNDKQRFRLKEEAGKWYICANQGHTLASVTPDLVLLTVETVPLDVYHGTFTNKLPLIEKEGLRRMKRNHIHMTSDAKWSVLGIRKSCSVLIHIDARKCIEDGFKLWRSENGVILCTGDENGAIPSRYFKEIEMVQKS